MFADIQKMLLRFPAVHILDFSHLIHRMGSGEDIKSLQQKLREMEKNQEDLQNKVAKKERDCEIKEQEKV
jgi:dishevelled associated activator of morphogenesis